MFKKGNLKERFNAKSWAIGAVLGTTLGLAYVGFDSASPISNDDLRKYDTQDFITTPVPQKAPAHILDNYSAASNGFAKIKGLTQDELNMLSAEHHARIVTTAQIAEDNHYYVRSFDEIIDGYNLIDLAKKMNPDKDYSRLDIKQLVEKNVNDMLEKLDYRSYYIKHETAKRWDQEDNNNGYAFGFLYLPHDDGIIIDVLYDGPAKAAGLQAGDVITHINGLELKSLGNNFLTQVIRNAKLSDTATLFEGITHADGQPFSIQTKAGEVKTTPVRASMIGGETLLLKLDGFTHGSHVLFREAFEDAAAQYGDQMKNIVIDLRGNGGGFVYAVNQMLDDFTDGDELGSVRERLSPSAFLARFFMDIVGDHLIDKIPSHKGQVTDLPINILIDSNSASASEIFAGNMQDVGRAKVIGKTASYGKATMQAPYQLDIAENDKPRVLITVGAIFLPKSGSYQGIGIQPDILVQPHVPLDMSKLYFEKDNPSILKNPSNNVAKPSPYTCQMTMDDKGQLREIWVDHVDVSNAYKKYINLAADEDLLCAIEDFKTTKDYAIIAPNTPKPQS